MESNLNEYLKDRRQSQDVHMTSEPLSAYRYEDALIARLKELGVSESEIIAGMKSGRNLERWILERNGVANVKLGSSKDLCRIQDLEICERGIDEISTVDENGAPEFHKETYMGEARFAYYYCDNCTESWSNQDFKTQQEAWEKAKEHLNEYAS